MPFRAATGSTPARLSRSTAKPGVLKTRAPRRTEAELRPFRGDVSTTSCRAALSHHARSDLLPGRASRTPPRPGAPPQPGGCGDPPGRGPPRPLPPHGQPLRRGFPPTVRRKVGGGRRGEAALPPPRRHRRPAGGFRASSPLRLQPPFTG